METQASLAQKLHVTISAVRSWEQDKSSPHETLVSICRLYQVSADYLLGLTRIDPVYMQQRRVENFSQEELDQLRAFEEFLMWKKKDKSKK